MATQADTVRYGYPLATTPKISERLKCYAHQNPADLVRVGVIGYGYWGPNVVRNLHSIEGCQVTAICDKNPAGLQRANRDYPGVELTTNLSELLTSTEIDAIAVVTPVWTHFELAQSALQNGKHVFVEKPFTSTAQQAEELIELADRNKLKIMVDHTFLFSGAVRKIRQLIDDGTLGGLYYFDSTRVNPGEAGGCRCDGRAALKRSGGCGFHHRLLSAQRGRPHQRQLAFSSQGSDHSGRR